MTAAPVLVAAEVSRLSAVASRLQSDHDGEVVSAARTLVRLLGKHNLRIGDVVERALRPMPAATSRPKPASPLREHQHHARRCLALGDMLWSPKERSFLDDMAVLARPISPAQSDWLAALIAKLNKAGGAHG